MKKIFVTGGSGLLGSKIILLNSAEFEIIGAFNAHPFELRGAETVQIDITNPSKTIIAISELAPDCIIHSAALRDMDYCERYPEAAWKTNVDGTRNIVNACNEIGAKLIFISTDMVFNELVGEKFREDSLAAPMNYYGKSKLEAEKLVLAGEQNAVARVSLLYGWHVLGLRTDFVGWVLEGLKNEIKRLLFTDQYRNVAFIDNVAEAILQLYKTSKTGIFHIAGSECINRYEFGTNICKVFGLDEKYLEPVDSSEGEWVAQRPRRCCLDISKAEHELDVKMLGVEEGLMKMKEQIIE